MKIVIGIMGGGEKAFDIDLKNSYQIGKFCAENNFVTLTGGRNVGVMNEGLKGAKQHGGLTLGILPNDDKESCSEYLDIPIFTNMRSGRNYINALSSNILVVCGIELGTSTEISLGLKAGKKVIIIGAYEEANIFYKKLGKENIFIVKDYIEAINYIKQIIGN